MRRLHALHAVAALVILCLAAGCPERPKKDPIPKPGPAPKEQPKTKPKAPPLPADGAYATGNVQAAVMEVLTTLDVPGLLTANKKPSSESQTLVVTDDRGKMVFSTDNLPVPKGTELRYNPVHKKYVLADPKKKLYWALTGGEVGSLLEGGPKTERSGYTIEVKDVKGKAVTIAGVKARQSDAQISLQGSFPTKDGKKTSKIKIKLSIWHTEDAKYKPAWGKMMVDFLTVPFQGAEGQKVVDKLKETIKFPVKWSMEVLNESRKDAKPFKMVTVAQKLEAKEVPKADLASPPAGYAVADERYNEWGEGGQTVGEEILGKIPAGKGKPPTKTEPTK